MFAVIILMIIPRNNSNTLRQECLTMVTSHNGLYGNANKLKSILEKWIHLGNVLRKKKIKFQELTHK